MDSPSFLIPPTPQKNPEDLVVGEMTQEMFKTTIAQVVSLVIDMKEAREEQREKETEEALQTIEKDGQEIYYPGGAAATPVLNAVLLG